MGDVAVTREGISTSPENDRVGESIRDKRSRSPGSRAGQSARGALPQSPAHASTGTERPCPAVSTARSPERVQCRRVPLVCRVRKTGASSRRSAPRGCDRGGCESESWAAARAARVRARFVADDRTGRAAERTARRARSSSAATSPARIRAGTRVRSDLSQRTAFGCRPSGSICLGARLPGSAGEIRPVPPHDTRVFPERCDLPRHPLVRSNARGPICPSSPWLAATTQVRSVPVDRGSMPRPAGGYLE